MKLLYDFFPILLFFITYKLYGMYAATAATMIVSVFQVIIYRYKHQCFDKMQLLGLGLIVVLGGATLMLHNPLFIKWKPTAIYWLTAIVFIGSQFFGHKPIIQRMMASNVTLPDPIWKKLNWAWGGFFSGLGGLNLYVAYQFDTDTWVNFKLFGATGLTLVFIVIQALFLAKFVSQPPKNTENNNAGTAH